MELRHLRYFGVVAEELSFRRAARRLHVSHPALSQQIHDLEDELGLKLLDRNSRRVELTEVGRVFLAGARRVIAAAKEAVTQAQEASKGERGRLVIGSIGSLTNTFLPDSLARFRDRLPLVEVTVLRMNNRDQVQALLDGSIMLGIGSFGFAADEDERKELCAELLLRSPVVVECSKHRRFPKRSRLTLKSFQQEKFLSLDPKYAYGYEDWLRDFCRQIGGFEPEIGAMANSSDSLLSMIAAGRGIFLGPEIGARPWITSIDYYPLNECERQFELNANWSKRSGGTATIHIFIEAMQESIKLADINQLAS
jgi:DNA-binding transcriptional LysR family regulator